MARKTRDVIQDIGNQVSLKEPEPEKSNPKGAGRKRGIQGMNESRKKVAELWYKGYTQPEICEKTGLSKKQVSDDIKVIKRLLEPKTIRQVEYYRNQSRNRLDIIRKSAWGIYSNKNSRYGARVAALNVLLKVEELSAKVDGVVADKGTAGPDKKAEELSKELVAIAKGKKDNGHKDVEVREVADPD